MNGTFISTWNDWTKAGIYHALATQYTPGAVKEVMRDIPKQASATVDDIHGKSTCNEHNASSFLGYYFTIKRKEKTQKSDIPYIVYESPVSSAHCCIVLMVT